MRVTGVITAHNEERTIGPLIERFLSERFAAGTELVQLRVVSSASVDQTDAIVRSWAERDARVDLITEPERRGKCAAINRALDGREESDLVLLSSADVLPDEGALASMVATFDDASVGMAGGRPVPTNDRRTFFGYAAHLLWAVHHHVASGSPKLGEIVAFRGDIDAIPEDLAVDEAALEMMVRSRGQRLAYVPEAIVRNRGAETLSEFLSQRRRISAGHYELTKRTGYEVATAGYGPAARGLWRELTFRPKELVFAGTTAFLCIWGRLLGAWDHYVARRTHHVWDIASSTKTLTSGSDADRGAA